MIQDLTWRELKSRGQQGEARKQPPWPPALQLKHLVRGPETAQMFDLQIDTRSNFRDVFFNQYLNNMYAQIKSR